MSNINTTTKSIFTGLKKLASTHINHTLTQLDNKIKQLNKEETTQQQTHTITTPPNLPIKTQETDSPESLTSYYSSMTDLTKVREQAIEEYKQQQEKEARIATFSTLHIDNNKR